MFESLFNWYWCETLGNTDQLLLTLLKNGLVDIANYIVADVDKLHFVGNQSQHFFTFWTKLGLAYKVNMVSNLRQEIHHEG